MEPENKKEIQLGWWKFVGLQAISIAIICVIMILFNFYPTALKRDYKALRKNYGAYKRNALEGVKKVERISFFLNQYKDQGKLSQNQSDSLKMLSSEINNALLNAESKKPYHLFPNYYQELANRYLALEESLKQASSGDCPSELASVKSERDRLEDKIDEIRKQFDDYRMSHP